VNLYLNIVDGSQNNCLQQPSMRECLRILVSEVHDQQLRAKSRTSASIHSGRHRVS